MNTDVQFIVAGDITCHKSIVVQQSVFICSWQWHSRNALLCFHCNWLRERASVLRYTSCWAILLRAMHIVLL